MVSLAPNSGATRFLIPKRLLQPQEQRVIIRDRPFIPDSELQERKLLESKLVSLLDDCDHLNRIKQVHAHVVRKGLDQCSYVLAKIIRTLTKVGVSMDPYPRLIFEQAKRPNPFLWTALIRGYSLQGSLDESVRVYSSMRDEGMGPVSFTFSALFKACAVALDPNLGRQIHAQVIRIGGFTTDLFVGNTMIDMYVKCECLDCGRKVFDEMPERDEISWTSLIVAYAKRGNMEAAGELFDSFNLKDMVAWTAMVTGYAQNAMPNKTLEFFNKMQKAGVETDEITLIGVISACAQLGAVNNANWVQNVAEKSGLGPTNSVVVGSALIDMYSKCGLLEDAYEVFGKMTQRTVYSYSSMIVGFSMHGHAKKALELFDQMVKTEIKPNRVTFIGVLTACSHSGLVEQGQILFEKMEKDYNITPSPDHYVCMVDLLGRAGRLKEALELIENMPIEPNDGVWGALLGACRIHGDADVADIAASHLLELEPSNIGNYILLSNIYGLAGRWEDVSRVRQLVRTKGLKKNPAISWFEGENGEIHEFFAGDSIHPYAKEIKRILGDVLERLKCNGYEPKVSCVPYDASEDDKRRILMNHSEKLAMAFGLATTGEGFVIRIVKNLRICEDCHLFICGASQVTRREIVVRDNYRFHHFRDGSCSCGNFW